MTSVRAPLFLLLSLLVGLCSYGCGSALELSEPMRAAADRYLTLMDRGQYAQVWSGAAVIFQQEVKQEDWLRRMSAVHAPLGKASGRAQRTAVAKANPANSPPGDYVMITFDSVFPSGEVVETLVLYREQDQWLLAGYFVK